MAPSCNEAGVLGRFIPDFGRIDEPPALPPERHAARCDAALATAGTDWVAVYADREHMANVLFLAGFEPRFEEALLLLGPGMHYPDHVHPAEEIYHLLGGTAEWWRPDEGWRRKAPGTVIRHPSMMRHAMRTGGEPMLALYCWTGEVATYASLSEEGR